MIPLSRRAQALAPSATLAMAAKARALRAAGADVVSFATGEPDFPTPAFIAEAAKRSLDAGHTKYPPSAGLPELTAAIREKLERENGLPYGDGEVLVTCGAKQAIFLALQALVDESDEVIVPAPYWVSYPEQVALAGGRPVIVPTPADTGFKLTPAALERAITPRTRAVILNTPSNPTGSAYAHEELAALGAICTARSIAIISDEIYEKLVYGDYRHISIAKACPQAQPLTIVINGVSKAYAMTGWRMGYAAGPRSVIAKMIALVEQQTSGIPPFVQMGCVAALREGAPAVEAMRREFEARRDLMLERLRAIPGLRCHTPEGAFYLLPCVEAYLGRRWKAAALDSATAVADYLLDEAHIATVSGDPFGAPGHIRLSYATSRQQIEEGMKRFAAAMAKIS